MTAYRTTAEVAELFRVSPRKVWSLAAEHGIGLRVRGRAGWRFSDADVEALAEALRPVTPTPARRRRRSA